MRAAYANWLRARGLEEGSVSTQLSRFTRVEDTYGDLVDLFASEGLDELIDTLRDSARSRRRACHGLFQGIRIRFYNVATKARNSASSTPDD